MTAANTAIVTQVFTLLNHLKTDVTGILTQALTTSSHGGDVEAIIQRAVDALDSHVTKVSATVSKATGISHP
jgi:hypothetical protein